MIAPGVNFDDIDAGHLVGLIASEVGERRTIEYKRDLPGGTDDERREFLADVTSFANAAGGDLLFGMRAEDGIPKEITPLDFKPDGERLTWEEVIRNGVQPRIPGIRIREIAVDGGHALLIRILQSWSAPHAVTYKNKGKSLRFCTRNSGGKSWLDVAELRDAFLASSSLGERINNFRAERIGRIVANAGPITLREGTRLVGHIVPYQGLTGRSSIELNAAAASGLFRPGFGTLSNDGERWNIDGLLTYSHHKGLGDGYTQAFRDGSLEFVDALSVQDTPMPNYESPVVSGHALERLIITGFANPLAVMDRLQISGPAAMFVTLIGVENYAVASGNVLHDDRGWHRFDRNVILLPDVEIEDVSAIHDYVGTLQRILRPVVDTVWQSAGFLRSPNFTAAGEWRPPTT